MMIVKGTSYNLEKWINDKVQLDSIENYIQYPGMNHCGKEYAKKVDPKKMASNHAHCKLHMSLHIQLPQKYNWKLDPVLLLTSGLSLTPLRTPNA